MAVLVDVALKVRLVEAELAGDLHEVQFCFLHKPAHVTIDGARYVAAPLMSTSSGNCSCSITIVLLFFSSITGQHRAVRNDPAAPGNASCLPSMTIGGSVIGAHHEWPWMPECDPAGPI